MSDDLDLIQAFTEEAAELLESFEQGLLELERSPGDAEVLNRIFRAAHTIKGNSGMLGFTDVAQFTHTLEDVLDRMRKGRLRVTQEGMTLLLRSLDMLKLKLDALARPEDTPPDGTQLIQELQAYANAEPTLRQAQGGGAESRESGAEEKGGRGAEGQGSRGAGEREGGGAGEPRISNTHRVPECRMSNVEGEERQGAEALPNPKSEIRNPKLEPGNAEEGPPRLGEILVAEKVVTPEEVASALKKQKRVGEILVEENLVTPEQLGGALGKQKRIGEILVEEKLVAPEQVARALEKQVLASPRGDAVSLRVQTEKVDKLINLVGEMVIAQSILSQIVSRFSMDQLPRLTDAVGELERNSRELQERVMAVRMVPIKTVFSRIPRLVRDLASQSGKKVSLEISGEETELDKTVVERIGDPLTHLVRNALDHGIEPPALRQAQGKPEQGALRLSARHESGNIVIRIADDGAGLNRVRILRKAVQQGMVQESEKLTDEQVYQLIFAAGLSTAETVTDVSGRGVGMDVVRKNIESLGGSVGIQSRPGRGSTFTIKLPLTLAILDGLSVQVGDEMYIVPLVNITESLRPKRSQVSSIVGQGEVVDVRGHPLLILRLYEVLGVAPRTMDPTEGLLVIVENGQERVALLVDELLGQHQVVIKSLEANYRKIPGVSGATIMGDGRVALILDVPGLVRLAAGRMALRPAA